MTGTQKKIRALFMTALMVFSVFAGTVAFSGAAAAAANDVSIDKATHYVDQDGDEVVEVVLNQSASTAVSTSDVTVNLADGSTASVEDVKDDGTDDARVAVDLDDTYSNIEDVEVTVTRGSVTSTVSTDSVAYAPVSLDSREDNDASTVNTTNQDVFVGTDIALILGNGNTADVVGPDFDKTRGPTSPSEVYVLDTDDRSTGTYNITQTAPANSDVESELVLSDLGLEFTDVSSNDIFDNEDVDIEVETSTVGRDITVELLNSDGDVVEDSNEVNSRISNQGVANVDNVFDQAGLATPDAGNYTIRVTDDNSGVTIESDTIVVSEAPDADVGFTQNEFSDQRGDVLEFTVTLEQTSEAEVQFGSDSDGYNVTFDVADNDGDGEVTVEFNTYNSTTGTASDAFSVVTDDEGDDDAISNVQERDGVSDIVAATTYDIRVESANAEDPALAAAVIEPRAQGTLNTWIAPAGGAPADLEGVNDAIGSSITENSEVASGDLIVLQLADVEGIEGLLDAQAEGSDVSSFTNATKGTDTGNISLSLTQQDVDPNDNPSTFDVTHNDNVTGVISDTTNDTYYVILDSSKSEIADGESEVVFGIETDTNRGLVDADEDEEINNTVDKVDPSLEITKSNVTATDDATVEGETNFAPGTEFRVRLQTTGNPSERFIESSIVTVQPDGTFTGTYALADAAPGDEYDITIGNTDANVDGLSTTSFDGTVEAAQETPTATPTVTPTATDEPTMGNMTTTMATATPTPTATATPTPTATPTDEPTATPPDEPTPTPTDEPTPTPTETSTSTPGFTAVLGVVALLGAALVALRRRN